MKSVHDELAKALADQGKLIEAGWVTLRGCILTGPDIKMKERDIAVMRLAFIGGAQHLFGSIMGILDPDAEPTDNDLRRMSLIATELASFKKELEQFAAPRRPQDKS